jgi:hypothetical protein
LPQYKDANVRGVHCHCRKYYRVFTGSEDAQARLAEQQAIRMRAIFIDARVTPFYQCKCGEVLDFMPEGSTMIQ